MTDYEKIKHQLIERRNEIMKRISDDLNEENESLAHWTGELSQYDNHPADTATDLYERQKDMALKVHTEQELGEIEAAINKINNGTYGVCEVSGDRIPFERLEANPTALTTIQAARNAYVPSDRPVEEEVLGGFDKYNFENRSDETEFDAEDSYQAVARFNETSMVYEGSSLGEADELIGSVEQIEGFISTGIEGYTGNDDIQIQKNVHYEQYLNKE